MRTLHAIEEGIKRKEFSAEEVVRFYQDRIAKYDEAVGAYLYRYPAPGDGIPIGLKDLLATKDAPTTCGSKMLEGYHPPYDATCVRLLREKGMAFLGKLNMDEFAMGSSNENSAYKRVCNPWNTDCVPGGSSGGSAAAVAAHLAPATLGSDTGGSIRQPAAFCGITGLKPTYGRVSRYGLVAFASSLDQIGPLTHDAWDAAILLGMISGHDPMDSTSANVPSEDFTKHLTGDVKDLRVGVPREYFAEGLDPAVHAAVRQSLSVLESAGAKLIDISMPHTEHAVAVYYLVATAEASSNLARFDGVRYGLRHQGDSLIPMYKNTRAAGFGPEVKRRIMLGTYSLSAGYYDAYYKKALEVRTLIQRDFLNAFTSVDVIATPTSPTVAFKFGEKSADPLTMYLSDIYTISTNLAGLPGISIPCGMDKGLPIGLQLMGRPFDEGTILRAADAYQRLTDWHDLQPEGFRI